MKKKFIVKKTGANSIMYLTKCENIEYKFNYYSMEAYTPTAFDTKKEAIDALKTAKESFGGGFAEILEVYDLSEQ